MTLYAVETAVALETSGEVMLADAIQLCRRLQQGSSLLSLAVTKGYTQMLGDGMRKRFRHLRHDLRNPLGTIKSILALMDDETIPVTERSNPRLHAMAKRNARLLGDLISNRLSDSEALLPLLAHQIVSLRALACSVRRNLRAEATARGATVLIAGSRTRVKVDAVGLELILQELLLAVLQEAVEGDELTVDFDEMVSERATVCLRWRSARILLSGHPTLDRLHALASQMGAILTVGDRVVLSFPTQRMEQSIELALLSGEVSGDGRIDTVADGLGRSVDGQARHDVRGPRQREHGKPGAF
jgi:signal transduction histidine kinase